MRDEKMGRESDRIAEYLGTSIYCLNLQMKIDGYPDCVYLSSCNLAMGQTAIS